MAPKQDDAKLAFTVDGKRYEIDMDDLEFGEVELLEEAFDLPFEEIDLRRMKAMRLIVFIAMRRKDPDVSMDDVAHIKIGSFLPEEDESEKRPTRKAPVKAA